MIETAGLVLKRVTVSDVDIYQAIMSCPNLTKYLPKGSPYTKEEIVSHVNTRVDHWKFGFGSYVVYLKNDLNKKLGYTGIETSPNPGCSDIRYGFKQDAQGKGYAFEAAKAVLEHTFHLGKHSKIFGVAVRANLPSVKILERLGMVIDNSVVIYDDTSLITLSVEKNLQQSG